MTFAASAAVLILGLVAVCLLYFLPAMVAETRGHVNTLAIFILNLLLGWTLLGWVVALVWACSYQEPELEESIE